MLLNCGARVDTLGFNGRTALHIAAENGDLNSAEPRLPQCRSHGGGLGVSHPRTSPEIFVLEATRYRIACEASLKNYSSVCTIFFIACSFPEHERGRAC